MVLGIDPSTTGSRRMVTPEDGELFEAKGLVIHSRGYLEVYVYENWSERHMPNFQMGEIVRPDKIDVGFFCTTKLALASSRLFYPPVPILADGRRSDDSAAAAHRSRSHRPDGQTWNWHGCHARRAHRNHQEEDVRRAAGWKIPGAQSAWNGACRG